MTEGGPRTPPTRERPGVLRLLGVVLVVGVAGAVGLFGSGAVLDRLSPPPADARANAGPRASLVEVTPAGQDTMRETVAAVGTIAAVQAVEIVPMSSGRVTDIAFSAGDRVEKGALLVQLDDRVERADLKKAEATLAEAEQAFARAEKLQKNNYAPEARFEEARANMLRAEAALDSARNALEDRSITAPFAGTTGLVEIETGQRIDTDTTVTSLDDLSEVEVTFWVPEVFFPRVARGQSVLVQSRAFEGRTFEGEVSEIDARISPRSRAFRVRATIPNERRLLRTGMFMSIELVLEEREAITVPEAAVVSEGDESFVFTLSGTTAEKRSVRTGLWRDGDVEVLEGLDAAASIITSGIQGIEDGSTVRLKEASDGTASGADGRG